MILQSKQAQEAVRLFNEGYHCSQAVNMAYGASQMDAEKFNLLCTHIENKYSSGNICGAVKGGLDVLYNYVKDKFDTIEKLPCSHVVFDKFFDAFLNYQGSLNCNELSSKFIDRNELRELSITTGQRVRKCSVFVYFSAQIASEILLEEKALSSR
ncbi:MAG: C-GCAxxG-C-C family protein [Bacteroidales bacterium]|nr:C-GCAxxG-C-C family protein [Bacteroidales bacterium]MCF8458554.1 C-GCAxxG-C-C family protein [Bacteroidales bacterium]